MTAIAASTAAPPAGSRALRIAAAALPFAAALLYAAIVAGPGVPALRHDWSWPSDRAGVIDLLTRSLSAWDPRGIGSSNLYLNDYIISLPAALCVLAFGAHAGLFVFSAAIAAACTLGAAALARSLGAGPWGRAAVAAIALFNPWVYAQTVAGHAYMILAFGALVWLTAECLRERTRPIAAALLVVLTLQQLQFFIAAVALAIGLAVKRRGVLPLGTAAIVSAPFFLSVAAELPAFSAVPYALAWTAGQSVAPADAFALTGYFAGYTQSVDQLARPVMWAVLVLALSGFASIARARRTLAFVALAASALVAAMGLRGPLAALEGFAMTSLPPARIFRELFDLLGFAAIGYCAGVAAAARRGAGAVAAGVAGCALAAAWLVWSPWAYWVPSASIPSAAIDAPPSTRFALFPAFQPLTRGDGAGSGLDPDATIRATGVYPVNTPFSAYPVDSALAAYEQRGDAGPLSDLGVSLLVRRAWLRSDDAALASQRAIAGTVVHADPAAPGIERLTPAPLLSLDGPPQTCGVCTSLGGAGVFFGDVAGMRARTAPAAWAAYPRVVHVPARTSDVRAAAGWVDARLAFAADPELGQPFGGVMTTSPQALLPVDGGLDALVSVRGRLVTSDGSVIASTTDGYRWVALRPDARAVRCVGLCVVALEAPGALAFPAEVPGPASRAPLALREYAPWLGRALVPAGGPTLLHYDVAYDRGWLAFGGGVLTHVRIDAVTNGWLLPARASSGSVTIVHWPSAIAALFEIAGFVWTAALAILLLRPLSRGHDEAARERRA